MVPSKLRIRTQQLVAQFCSGDDRAYAELYDMYVQMLYNYGLKMTSDQELLKDCIHDVFVKVYMKRNDKNAITTMTSGIRQKKIETAIKSFEEGRTLENHR